MLMKPMPEKRGKPDPKPPQPREYRRGTGLRMLLLAAALGVALVLGFRLVNYQRAQETELLAESTKTSVSAPPPVDVVRVKASPATQKLMLPGETAAWYDSKIYARVNGYVAKWNVDIGDHVGNGQVLAVIETPELDAELLAARAKLKAADAQVQVKQADADFAKSTYDRWRNSPQGVVSEQERESKKAAFVAGNAQLLAAKAQVSLDQADVDRLSALQQFKQVKAPFAGTIVRRDIDIGNLVTAGSTSSTSSLYRISLDEPMRVFVNVPQSAAAELLKGTATAMVHVGDADHCEAGGKSLDRCYAGKVTRTSKSINPQARTLRVEVDIHNPDSTLVPGMYVQVGFDIDARSGVQIPAAALLFRPGPQVAIVDNRNIVTFHDVKIGVDDGNVVQITSGLKEGDKVVLNISSQVAPGEKVEPRDTDDRKSSGKVAER